MLMLVVTLEKAMAGGFRARDNDIVMLAQCLARCLMQDPNYERLPQTGGTPKIT